MENKLRELRNRLNLSAKKIADALNVSLSYYYKLERGEKRLNVDHLLKLSNSFNVSIDYLTGKDGREEVFPNNIIDINGNGITMLPVIGEIAAGIPITAIPEHGEYMPFDTKLCNINGHALDEYFYLRIKGDSMEPTMSNGDVALVRRQSIVDNGEVAVVLCDSENAVCKRVTITKDSIILNSDNKSYAPMVYEANNCLIIGKVIGHYGVIK